MKESWSVALAGSELVTYGSYYFFLFILCLLLFKLPVYLKADITFNVCAVLWASERVQKQLLLSSL